MTNANLRKKADFMMEKITIERNQIDYFQSELRWNEQRIEQLEEDIVDLQNQMDEDPNYDSSLLSIVTSYQEDIQKLYSEIDEYLSSIKFSKLFVKEYMEQYDEIVGIDIENDFKPMEFDETFDDLINEKNFKPIPAFTNDDLNLINNKNK